jgi:transposase
MSRRKGHRDFVTVVADIERGQLIEVIDSHQQADIMAVLKQQPLAVRQQVEEVSVDMWGGFAKVIETVFPNAEIVFDRFHGMQQVNKELNKIRQQTGMTIRGSRYI